MDIKKYYAIQNEQPLDNVLDNGGFSAIFRTIACIGDSLSSGEFEIFLENGNVDYIDTYEQSWGQYIARMTGAKVYNFSSGGMTAERYVNSFAEENGFWNKEFASQAYILALGVNDIFSFNLPFGDFSDIDFKDYNNNKNTFIGNYARIIQRYKEIQPDAKFFLMSMPKDKEINNPKKAKHLDALKKFTEIFSNCYVIDLFSYAPIYDEKFKENFYLNGHMNPQGYLLTAKMVASYIDYIIRNNHSDFKLVGLIGQNN